MTEKQKSRKKQKKVYVHRPNSVCVTLHSPDGRPVPREVLDEAASSIEHIAIKHNLLINVAEA